MSDNTIHLEPRSNIGSGKARRLREEGYIPSVVYGRGMTPMAAQVKASELRQFLAKNGRNSLFTTEFAAENDFSVLVKDIQYDSVTKDVVHVDFQKVSLNEKVHAEVPIKVIGSENVIRTSNVIVHQLDRISVESLPQHVPKYIAVNVSDMYPGQSITAGDLHLPEGVTLLTPPSDVILSITSGGHLDLKVDKVDEPVAPVGEEGEVEAVSEMDNQ